MNVVDSSAWIEFFVDGPNARFFSKAIRNVDALLVPSVVVLEVYRYVLRERGRQDALETAAALRQGRVIDLTQGLAIEAAELGASYGLPLTDSVIYATAVAHDATLWTQDSHFEGLDAVQYRSKRGSP